MSERTIQLEPDRAREYCLNLIRDRQPFAVEIDPRLIKDLIVIYRGAVLEGREGWSHVPKRAVNRDEASHYVQGLIAAELTFQVTPERVGDRDEWRFLVEMRSDGRRVERAR